MHINIPTVFWMWRTFLCFIHASLESFIKVMYVQCKYVGTGAQITNRICTLPLEHIVRVYVNSLIIFFLFSIQFVSYVRCNEKKLLIQVTREFFFESNEQIKLDIENQRGQYYLLKPMSRLNFNAFKSRKKRNII